jgi:hypothetical protein
MPKWMDAETYNALPDYLQVREIEVDGRVRWAMAKAALLSQILPSVLNELWAFLKSICVTTAANVQDG